MHDMTALKRRRPGELARSAEALRRPDLGLETVFPSLDGLMKRERTLLDSVTAPPEDWLAGTECATLGTPRRGLFRVLDGVCLGCRLFSDGRRHILSIYLPGDLIGPDCIIAETSREKRLSRRLRATCADAAEGAARMRRRRTRNSGNARSRDGEAHGHLRDVGFSPGSMHGRGADGFPVLRSLRAQPQGRRRLPGPLCLSPHATRPGRHARHVRRPHQQGSRSPCATGDWQAWTVAGYTSATGAGSPPSRVSNSDYLL